MLKYLSNDSESIIKVDTSSTRLEKAPAFELALFLLLEIYMKWKINIRSCTLYSCRWYVLNKYDISNSFIFSESTMVYTRNHSPIEIRYTAHVCLHSCHFNHSDTRFLFFLNRPITSHPSTFPIWCNVRISSWSFYLHFDQSFDWLRKGNVLENNQRHQVRLLTNAVE